MAPLNPAQLAPPYARFRVSLELAEQYYQLFVNRPIYSLQATRPMMGGKVGWYLARDQKTRELKVLDERTIQGHINGVFTINLYPINPETQRSKWVAIDADYEGAIKDLLQLRFELTKDDIYGALEQSRRGGHLWIFADTPLLASECRIYIYNLALRLGIPVKGGGLREGLEVFPAQDTLKETEFGNALRGPLGVHRRTGRRYWFYGAEQTPEKQMSYLLQLPKLTEDQLKTFTQGMQLPEAYQPPPPVVYQPRPVSFSSQARREFNILEHVKPRRKDRRNYWAQCPSCARINRDQSRDNLAIKRDDPRFYKCWAGCTKEEIRAALGQPIPRPRVL
jgi:hypothetical protein